VTNRPLGGIERGEHNPTLKSVERMPAASMPVRWTCCAG